MDRRETGPNKGRMLLQGTSFLQQAQAPLLGSLGAPCELGIGLLMDPSLPSGLGGLGGEPGVGIQQSQVGNLVLLGVKALRPSVSSSEQWGDNFKTPIAVSVP